MTLTDDVKYYLVSLCDKDLQRMPESYNRLVIGDPIDWFTLLGVFTDHVLINFWEVSERAFREFPAEMQDAAWEDFNRLAPSEE